MDNNHPRAMMYIPLKGDASPDPRRAHMDGMNLEDVYMNQYHDHP